MSRIAELLTGTDVARRIGVSRERLRQMIVAGKFLEPLGKVGNSYVWRARDVEGWLNPLLEATSGGVKFRTIPHRPGFISIDEGDGRRRGAVSWAGARLVKMRGVRNGVEVETARQRGRITKNPRGSWTLSDATRL